MRTNLMYTALALGSMAGHFSSATAVTVEQRASVLADCKNHNRLVT